MKFLTASLSTLFIFIIGSVLLFSCEPVSRLVKGCEDCPDSLVTVTIDSTFVIDSTYTIVDTTILDTLLALPWNEDFGTRGIDTTIGIYQVRFYVQWPRDTSGRFALDSIPQLQVKFYRNKDFREIRTADIHKLISKIEELRSLVNEKYVQIVQLRDSLELCNEENSKLLKRIDKLEKKPTALKEVVDFIQHYIGIFLIVVGLVVVYSILKKFKLLT